jgi:hypothetical protein
MEEMGYLRTKKLSLFPDRLDRQAGPITFISLYLQATAELELLEMAASQFASHG